jgi:hypothetical protein
MKGLYLNVPDASAAIARLDRLLGLQTACARGRNAAFPQIVIGYHAEAWPEGPVVDEPGFFAAASGWFLFRGRMGDLRGLARAFAEARAQGEEARVLLEISAGAYLILLGIEGEGFVITDPFGLHPHYFADQPFSQIAPAPCFLKEGRAPVPKHAAILQARGHLFGNLTLYRGIERLEPGAMITRGGVHRWFRYESERRDVLRVRDTMADGLASLRAKTSILPLSGGLDSRLIALSGSFDYAYTYGPDTTGDRPVARRFSGRFREYREFSLLDLSYPIALRDASSAIFDGTCTSPFSELVAVYKHIHGTWGGGFFFDGYLGDVLQHGAFLVHDGIRGSLAKLLPWVTLRGFDALALLRRRYSSLRPESFALLVDLFRKKMDGMDLDGPHKVQLFEILYGRGARYMANGGSILSSQFWTTVQPFCLPPVFRLLFGQSMEDALSYRTLRRVWSAVPRSDAEIHTYSGFSPLWNGHRARTTMLLVKAMGKVGLYKRATSYECELPRIRWT